MVALLSQEDIYLFHQGTSYESFQFMGAHLKEIEGQEGVYFVLWAPLAKAIMVVGDFNDWTGEEHAMSKVPKSGLWELFIPNLKIGDIYKYKIITSLGKILYKADPYAFYAERRPATASKIYALDTYSWQDGNWQKRKKESYQKPILIYELHLGSFRQKNEGQLNYREMVEVIIPYVKEMGYTHIEVMPVTEHPLDASWGYQTTGYYAVTSRYGEPKDLMYFIDQCHQQELSVILDWVPGHFCKDEQGLRQFDGTCLYEDANPLISEHKGWGTLKFDFKKPEVWSFLISNAIFWLEKFHIDGFRMDAVASMLYLDYNKQDGEWIKNKYGGREDLECIEFLRKLNEVVYAYYPHTLMMAEESTDWPLVTWPTYLGGLGFNYKWNMGWMNDMLDYMATDPSYRPQKHNLVTFSLMYAFSENFVLPLSHDEVVHGKKSLLDKMPGTYDEKFANLRLFYAYFMTHPGKKLLFMGGEFGHFREWDEKKELDWNLLEYEKHQKMHTFVKELNHFYVQHKCLWEYDHDWQGFTWINPNDAENSVISFMRHGKKQALLVICNFKSVRREKYRIGVLETGKYQQVFSTDLDAFGGKSLKKTVTYQTEAIPFHQQNQSICIDLPSLCAVFLQKK
jgi:1,4-alpha-glucan branching enzyme